MAGMSPTPSSRPTGKRTNSPRRSGLPSPPACDAGHSWTGGKKSSSGPALGTRYLRRLRALNSDRDGKRQIYVIAPAGGEAAQLTAEDNGVGNLAWAPDGSAIAFTFHLRARFLEDRKDRKDKYGEFDIIGGDYVMSHLWRVAVPAEIPADIKKLPKPEALTKGETFSVSGFSWSPDARHIAFSATRDPDLGSQDTEQIYILDLADLHVRKLAAEGGPHSRPKWSPDGKQIAFVTANGQPFFFYANRYIAVVPADGGKPKVLTEAFDEDANLIDWGPDGIYFSALQRTNAHIFRISPRRRRGAADLPAPTQFASPEAFVLPATTKRLPAWVRPPITSPRFTFRPSPNSRPSISAMSPVSGKASSSPPVK